MISNRSRTFRDANGATRQLLLRFLTKFVSPVNKQINDKERVAAAMENPNLRDIVEQCVAEPDD